MKIVGWPYKAKSSAYSLGNFIDINANISLSLVFYRSPISIIIYFIGLNPSHFEGIAKSYAVE